MRTSPPDKYAAIDHVPAVTPLVGMRVAELRGALGEPDYAGNNRVIYRFFRLPHGSLGGGPELMVTAAENGIITRAQWQFLK